MRYKFLSITAVVLLICVIAWSSYSQQSKLPKAWEYMVINDPGTSQEGVKYLNDLGAQGWELVAVSDNVINQGNQTLSRFVLKRSK